MGFAYLLLRSMSCMLAAQVSKLIFGTTYFLLSLFFHLMKVVLTPL